MNFYKKENFKSEIKPMIENLQDELYQLENKQSKVLMFVLTSVGSWSVKNGQKYFSKYLKDRIFKIKQYLNHILMIINQEIPAILRTFSNMQKKKYKKLIPRRQLPKLLLLAKFLSKIPNRKKIYYGLFNLFEAKASLYGIIKPINSQTNNESSGNDALTADKHFSNELAPIFQMSTTPRESLAILV